MATPKKTFPYLGRENYPQFLDDVAATECRVDNPDGAFVDCYGLGPYAVGGEKGREYSQGAGTPKGSGNASGRGQTMRVKGGSR